MRWSWIGFVTAIAIALPWNTGGTPQKRQTDNIAILPVVVGSAPGQTSISEIFAQAVDATNMRMGLRALPFEQISVDIGARVRECGSDSRCIASVLRAFDARLALVVVVNFALEPTVIQVQLLDTDERRLLDSDVVEIEEGQTVHEMVRARVQHILERAGYEKSGRFIAEVLPGDARIWLDRTIEPDVGTPNVFTVLPGRYELFAEANGHEPGSMGVEIRSGAETRVRLELVKEATLLESPWFWGAVGTAVVGGTALTLLLTRGTERCVCTQLCQGGTCFGCESCP